MAKGSSTKFLIFRVILWFAGPPRGKKSCQSIDTPGDTGSASMMVPPLTGAGRVTADLVV